MVRRLLVSLSLLVCASCILDQQAIGPGRSLEGSGGSAGSAGSAGSGAVGGTGGNLIGSECTVASEDADCDGKSCNPVTHECTDFGKWTSRTCEPCVSDENCWESNHRCVPMYFEQKRFPNDHTGVCLPQAQQEFVGAPYHCDGEEPFVMVLYDRISMSDAGSSAYCGPREDFTTCDAVLAQLSELACPDGRDDQCPTGGLCRYVQDNGKWDYRCTYACTSDSECRNKQGWELYCGGYCGA